MHSTEVERTLKRRQPCVTAPRTGRRFRGGARCPRSLSGEARLHEWYDDATDRFRIEVAVENRHVGPVFGYSGSFTARYVVDTAPVPAVVRPLRENPRE